MAQPCATTRQCFLKHAFGPLEEMPVLWGDANPCLLMVKRLADRLHNPSAAGSSIAFRRTTSSSRTRPAQSWGSIKPRH